MAGACWCGGRADCTQLFEFDDLVLNVIEKFCGTLPVADQRSPDAGSIFLTDIN